MDHRQLFRTSPTFETDHDQNGLQPSLHLGASRATEGPFAWYTENRIPEELSLSNWNSSLRLNEFVPAGFNMELPHQPPVPAPPYHPLRHPPVARSFCPVTPNYSDHPSSSQYTGSSSSHYEHPILDYENAATRSANGRGLYKRRRTSAPVVQERESGYHNVGSSSDPASSFFEKPNSSSQQWPWEIVSVTPSNRGGGLSIGGEPSQRNVRSRSTLDFDASQARSNGLTNPSFYPNSSGRIMDLSAAVDHPNLGSSSNPPEWTHSSISSDSLARIATGPSAFTRDTDHFRLGNSGASTSSHEIHSHRPNLIASRSHLVPVPHVPGAQPVRVGHSSYVQRAIPRSRGHLHSGHVASASDRAALPDSYSSSYPRVLSSVGWSHTDWSRRMRTPYQRSSPLSGAPDFHDRLGFMMVDHSTLYDSRNLLDQHRDMRLDVDNMSYEELLALEERIGNVSTGLSEDSMSNCLKEKTYYLSDETHDENNCVICLEEYKSQEIVATLVNCGHDYHTDCIRKWLSMKKVCPICKASVLADS
ncbi:RING-type E3 ubiquitin transferase [Ranunculus cassubicifolius]